MPERTLIRWRTYFLLRGCAQIAAALVVVGTLFGLGAAVVTLIMRQKDAPSPQLTLYVLVTITVFALAAVISLVVAVRNVRERLERRFAMRCASCGAPFRYDDFPLARHYSRCERCGPPPQVLQEWRKGMYLTPIFARAAGDDVDPPQPNGPQW